MAPIHSTVKQLIDDNSKDDFIQAATILLKFANNILQNPNEQKYRKIRLANPTIESKLLPVSGALECLFEMGFTEDGEFLTLPIGNPIHTLKQIRDELDTALNLVKLSVSGPTAGATSQSSRTPGQPTTANRPRANVQQLERMFMNKLESNVAHVLQYEDIRLQQKALGVIPLADLRKNADVKLERIQREDAGATVCLEDLLLLELLAWFKNSFFKWTDAPKCDSCNGNTRSAGMAPPLPDEQIWGASRVENYKCDTCQKHVRFPRYNHPGKLLETRNGRCGEWANCFTLCCRAVGFEARFVLDWTDHVWTEVYSKSQKRWLHCDPCENVCDKPLLYEAGWGKKLTYVIAFSKDEVQDVSMRYSTNHRETLKRRNEVRESWLVNVCHRLWEEKQKIVSPERRNEMAERLVAELVELITEKSANNQQLGGRTTGSLAWRLARGETGAQGSTTVFTSYTFTPTTEEKQKNVLHIRYNCAKDVYTRDDQQVPGYQSQLFSVDNMFRKEEHDWKMVYLARKEGTETASLAWKFDFTGSGKQISYIEIRASSATYENGRVMWKLCSENNCVLLNGGSELQKVTDIDGATSVTLTADLSGGKGDVAWQHTQLFRQSLDDVSSCPLEIIIHMK